MSFSIALIPIRAYKNDLGAFHLSWGNGMRDASNVTNQNDA